MSFVRALEVKLTMKDTGTVSLSYSRAGPKSGGWGDGLVGKGTCQKTHELSSNSGAHMVEEENQLLQLVL